MKQMARVGIALTVLAMLGACAAETGTSSEALHLADKAAVEAELFYIDTSVSEAPLTLNAIEDTTCAIPVRIQFLEELAVAYYAPDGEPILDEDHIVAMWAIAEHVAPTDGELETEGTLPPPEVPTPAYPTPEIDHRLDMNPISEEARGLMKDGVNAPYARIDWLRRHFTERLHLPPGVHPGC